MDHTAPDLPPPINVSTPTVSTHIAGFGVLAPALKNGLGRHQLEMFVQAGTQIHKPSGQSAFVCVPLVLVLFCTQVSSEAALIYKICLNLRLARPVCSSAQPYCTINQPQCPYSWALQRVWWDMLKNNPWSRTPLWYCLPCPSWRCSLINGRFTPSL